MTPDELRALAGEATPGPWTVREPGPNGTEVTAEKEPGFVEFLSMCIDVPDASLIALAPQLALLCAEMGEALRDLADWANGNITGDDFGEAQWSRAHAALEALEKP